jgi:hypothetical protein
MKKILLLSFTGIILLSGCSSHKQVVVKRAEAFKYFYKEKPVAILIMPPINRTENVEAKEAFHTTLNSPLSNAGYYVIPPFLSMEILKRESAYDAELFLDAPLEKFGDVFGADLALFTIIHKWNKKAFVNTVEVEFICKSIKTNEVVYQRKGSFTVNSILNSGNYTPVGLIVSAVATAVTTIHNSVSDNTIVSSACSNGALLTLPAGPYSPLMGMDGEDELSENVIKEVKLSLSGSSKQIRTTTELWYSRYTKKTTK